MKHLHRVAVLGRELQVKSSAPPGKVEKIVAFLESKIHEVEQYVKGGDTQVVAILTLMNLAETVLDLLEKQNGQDLLVKEKLAKLIAMVEERQRAQEGL
jgi:cell division protein ZapA